jgi:hypothetical protein
MVDTTSYQVIWLQGRPPSVTQTEEFSGSSIVCMYTVGYEEGILRVMERGTKHPGPIWAHICLGQENNLNVFPINEINMQLTYRYTGDGVRMDCSLDHSFWMVLDYDNLQTIFPSVQLNTMTWGSATPGTY